MTAILVAVSHASDLKDTERFGKQDPYVRLSCGSQTWKTSTLKNAGTSGTFNESTQFQAQSGDSLTVSVYNDNMGRDTLIGQAVVPLGDVLSSGSQQLSVELKDPKDRPAGNVQIRMTAKEVQPMTAEPAGLATRGGPPINPAGPGRYGTPPSAYPVGAPSYASPPVGYPPHASATAGTGTWPPPSQPNARPPRGQDESPSGSYEAWSDPHAPGGACTDRPACAQAPWKALPGYPSGPPAAKYTATPGIQGGATGAQPGVGGSPGPSASSRPPQGYLAGAPGAPHGAGGHPSGHVSPSAPPTSGSGAYNGPPPPSPEPPSWPPRPRPEGPADSRPGHYGAVAAYPPAASGGCPGPANPPAGNAGYPAAWDGSAAAVGSRPADASPGSSVGPLHGTHGRPSRVGSNPAYPPPPAGACTFDAPGGGGYPPGPPGAGAFDAPGGGGYPPGPPGAAAFDAPGGGGYPPGPPGAAVFDAPGGGGYPPGPPGTTGCSQPGGWPVAAPSAARYGASPGGTGAGGYDRPPSAAYSVSPGGGYEHVSTGPGQPDVAAPGGYPGYGQTSADAGCRYPGQPDAAQGYSDVYHGTGRTSQASAAPPGYPQHDPRAQNGVPSGGVYAFPQETSSSTYHGAAPGPYASAPPAGYAAPAAAGGVAGVAAGLSGMGLGKHGAHSAGAKPAKMGGGKLAGGAALAAGAVGAYGLYKAGKHVGGMGGWGSHSSFSGSFGGSDCGGFGSD